MNNQPNWNEAPEGYPLWIESKMDSEGHDWHKDEGDLYRDPKGGVWWKDGEGREYIVHRRPVEWDGVGTPPVGVVCEALWNESRLEYLKCKVFGVNEHGEPIFRFEEGPKKFEYQADPLRTATRTPVFRPIRTPEQIANEKREAAISQIMVDAGIHDSAFKDDPEARAWAAALHDKGYVPPEAK